MNAALLELQHRVRDAELRVMACDAALRQRIEQTRAGWQRSVRQVRRWLPLTGGAAVAAGVLWWLLKPRRAAVEAPPSRARARSPSADSSGRNGHWVRAVGLLWPLVPARWRAHVSPATAAALASIGLPLLEALAADKTPPPATAPDVDLAHCMGTWYEIARLPTRLERRCAGQPSACWAWRDGGVRITHRCLDDDGREQVAVGFARIVPGDGDAKLEVTFLPPLLHRLPLAWADYWILHVDLDYRFAVVGDPNRRNCWLLAREPSPAPAERERLVRITAARGFAIERLIHVDRDPAARV